LQSPARQQSRSQGGDDHDTNRLRDRRPVEHGLVGSLNRPGGNVTGVTMASAELRPKMLQLLNELVQMRNPFTCW
jgi:hypothetical protein